MSFSSFNLDRRLEEGVRALGFTQPTPIQVATIPAALTGQDILGSAETGTGKTAAYLLPILQRFLAAPARTHQVRALILVPTRELALQVAEHGELLSAHIARVTLQRAGVERVVHNFAFRAPFSYGIIAVVLAVLSGLLASAFFRREAG